MKTKSGSIIIAAALAVCALIAIANAQAIIDGLTLADVKSNGTKIGYFTRGPGQILYWDFKGGPAQAIKSGSTLSIGSQWAPYNPDMGSTFTAGAQLLAVDRARPTCDATHRGEFYTVATSGTGDAGVKDLTYQCCKAAAGTFAWVAVACQ